jgi:hypothetical protein
MNDALLAVRAMRAALSGNSHVRHVCLGLAPDRGSWKLAIWIYTDGTAIDPGRIESPLPVVVFGPEEACDGIEPNSQLQSRADPPSGGFLAGPDELRRGTFGLLGYIGSQDAMAFCSAAHVFTVNGQLSVVARQPASRNSEDIISTRPVDDLTDLDIALYRVEPKARNWARVSAIALQGTLIGTIRDPKIDMRVRKTGERTALTSGTVKKIGEGPYFTVGPDPGMKKLSCPGDSGAAWVDVRGNLIGIHVGSLDGMAVAVKATEVCNRIAFQPYAPKDEL